jgi:hypothetical protein
MTAMIGVCVVTANARESIMRGATGEVRVRGVIVRVIKDLGVEASPSEGDPPVRTIF